MNCPPGRSEGRWKKRRRKEHLHIRIGKDAALICLDSSQSGIDASSGTEGANERVTEGL